MFCELIKYKNKGHFSFKKEDKLREKSKDVPNQPGVYYIIRLAKGKPELVYIGKAGSVEQNGIFKSQGLRGRINNKQDGMKRQEFFTEKCIKENIDALDIYWFVTYNKNNQDLPGYVEALLLQTYFEINETLPEWNKSF